MSQKPFLRYHKILLIKLNIWENNCKSIERSKNVEIYTDLYTYRMIRKLKKIDNTTFFNYSVFKHFIFFS